MTSNQIQIACLAVAFAFVAWGSYALLTLTQEVRERMDHLVGPRSTDNFADRYRIRGLVTLVTYLFGSTLAPSAVSYDRKLLLAGRPWGGISGAEYLATAIGLGTCAASALFLMFAAAAHSILVGIGAAFVGIVIATTLTITLVDGRVADRQATISREFPYFLDLLIMTQRAQATLRDSLELYASAAPGTAMAQEIESTLKDISMGTGVISAMERLSDRVPSPEVVRTLQAIVQGEREGSNRLMLLSEHATDIRFRRWEAAESAGEKLKTKVSMPTMLIVVSVLFLVLAPAFVGMISGRMS